jgi:hypothetical protein
MRAERVRRIAIRITTNNERARPEIEMLFTRRNE